MKKILIGLATGIAIGFGISSYTHKPKQEATQTAEAKCEQQQQTYAPAITSNRLAQKFSITEDSMKQYGDQLYNEIDNGDCLNLTKFIEAKEQLKGVYTEYGFEKAYVLYQSLMTNLEKSENKTCDFYLNRDDLSLELLSTFNLEDFRKTPDITSLSLVSYLKLQNSKTRAEYIRKVCKDQEKSFITPGTKDLDCRYISYYFPNELTSNMNLPRDVPEMVLTTEYLQSLTPLTNEMIERGLVPGGDGIEPDDPLWKKIEKLREGIYMKLGDLACQRYQLYLQTANENEELLFPLDGIAMQIFRNIELAKKVSNIKTDYDYISDGYALANKIQEYCKNKQ